MRYFEICESPIANVTIMGDPDSEADSFSKGTSFDSRDRALLSSPKGIQKIVRMFQNTPHVFEVFFINSDVFDAEDTDTNDTIDTHIKALGAGIRDRYAHIAGKKGVIRVVMIGNLSPISDKQTVKMPMNGWTLAHKIGHSIQDEIVNRSGENTRIGKLAKEINDCLFDIFELVGGTDIGARTNKFAYSMSGTAHNLIKRLTMKSARDGTLNNDFEIFPEIIAQYLIKGSFQINAQDGKDAKILSDLEDIINNNITDIFHNLSGKVIVEL